MSGYILRQSTASQEVMIGPFLLAADGSVVTDLTIANTDIEIYKAGSTTHVDKHSGGATHSSKGMYSMVFDADDTNTIGSGVACVQVAGALPCKVAFTVFDEAVYDMLFGTTAPSTYAGGDTSGVTTLLTRIVGTLASGTHNPQSGDAFARLGAPVGASISADIAALVASMLAGIVEGSITLQGALRLALAALVGEVSGAPDGPIVFRDTEDSTDRITATIDEDGNRTAVTLDAT